MVIWFEFAKKLRLIKDFFVDYYIFIRRLFENKKTNYYYNSSNEFNMERLLKGLSTLL